MGGDKKTQGGCLRQCLQGLASFCDASSTPQPRNRITSIDEALQLTAKPRAGSFMPNNFSRQVSNPWATPTPQRKLDGNMVLVDLDSDVKIGTRGSLMGSKQSRSKFEVEQMLCSPGSLSAPDPKKYEAAIRDLKPTATFEHLAEVRHLLDTTSSEAQELRRSIVRGATVVFISAGYPGKRFIFERLAEMNVKSVIIDHPDSWSRHLVAEGIIAKFLPVDMSQSSQDVFKQAEALIRRLADDGLTGSADGITTFVELSVPLASRLCESFGLPGFRPAAVDAARDKHQTRAALKRNNLPTPKNFLIANQSQLTQAGSHVGFPAVLKPVSGAASLGVKKVLDMKELASCYQEVVNELSSLVVSSGALVKNTGDGGVNASKVVDLTVLLEQYLDGQEVDVDVVMSDGEYRYAAVADNGPTLEPYFNETWGLCPSMLSKEKQRALKSLAVDSVKALGFDSGVFHVECKYTSSGPQLIEVNARMGGGPVREVNRRVWGVDLVEEGLYCALGIPSRPAVPDSPNTCIGYAFVNAQKSGRLVSTTCIEALQGRDGVVSADPLVQPGDKVTCFADGLPTWLALLVVERPSSQKALDYVLSLEKELPLQITA